MREINRDEINKEMRYLEDEREVRDLDGEREE